MQTERIQFLAVGVLGLLAPLWWTWLGSQLVYGLYVAGGMPEHPSPLFFWTSTLVPSLTLGLLTGGAIVLLVRERPILAWSMFFGCLVVAFVASAFVFAPGSDLGGGLRSVGSVAFLVASFALPLGVSLASRRG